MIRETPAVSAAKSTILAVRDAPPDGRPCVRAVLPGGGRVADRRC